MNSVGVQPAHVVIEPDVTSIGLSEFSQTSELAAIGEGAVQEVTPKVKSLLSQIDGDLFAPPWRRHAVGSNPCSNSWAPFILKEERLAGQAAMSWL